MSAFEDVAGVPVQAGDTIAVAFRSGNLAEVRTGEVVELFTGPSGWYGNREQARVRWLKGRRLPQSAETTIDWTPSRIVRVAS